MQSCKHIVQVCCDEKFKLSVSSSYYNRVSRMSEYNIKVVCRLRPLNNMEIAHGGECCVKHTDKSIQIHTDSNEANKYQFAFDRVLPPDTTQGTVYDEVAVPVLKTVMAGFNGTVFAYGQTGGGKTWTMEGPSHDDPQLKGLIPRMMEGLFQNVLSAETSVQFTIKCSYIEIYNEKIFDLLDPSKNKLEIKEDKLRGIFIQGCTEVYVSSVTEMRNAMSSGSQNRKIAFTGMNQRSSRSHSLFIVQVDQKDMKKGSAKHAKLYFVDLAGSEKVGKTGVKGQQLEEAKNINKSLSCLGNVINALTSEKKEHIPYRDSKLTRILQQSLGGNSRTTLIINCSMCSYNDRETLGTLRFGQRAKSIKNKAFVNEQKSAKQLQLLLEEATKTIHRLKDEMKGSGIQSPMAQVERDEYEARIQELTAQLLNRSELEKDKDTSSVGGDLELRIKTLLIENKHMQETYQKEFEVLAQRNFKQQQTINTLIYKENVLEKLLDRLKGDLDFLRLNLKYDEKRDSIENKVVETIDRVQEIIYEFFSLITNMKQIYPDSGIDEINDLMVDRKAKLESSLSEPNLHEPLKLSKGFQEISVIIKERIAEGESEDEKEVEDSSTEFETLITTMSTEKRSLEDLMAENAHLSKMLQEITVKHNKLAEEIKLKEEKIEEFCTEKIQEFEQHYELQQCQLKMMDKKLLQSMQGNTRLQNELSEEKSIGQRLLKVIESNGDMNQRYKLDQRLKEYATERQKMFNEIYALREQLDEADVSLKEKDDLIESLKTAIKQSDMQAQSVYMMTPESIKKEYAQAILGGSETKNIAKPIRGGGIMVRQEEKEERRPSQQNMKSVLRNKLGPIGKKQPAGIVGSIKSFFQ